MANPSPTDADRKAAVAIADALGIEEASHRTGYSIKTISSWSSKDIYRTHTRARVDFTKDNWADQLSHTLKGIALMAANRELELVSASELGLANKIRTTAVHDVQLLDGKATERTEAVEATEQDVLGLIDLVQARKAQDILSQ